MNDASRPHRKNRVQSHPPRVALLGLVVVMATAGPTTAQGVSGSTSRTTQADATATPAEKFATLLAGTAARASEEIVEGFLAVARETNDDRLRQAAVFNAGRVSIDLFDQAIRETGTGSERLTPEQLETLLRSAENRFLAAYRLDPRDLEAAQNVERTRRLLDHLRQAREQAEQQRQRAQELANELDQLADRQADLADQSRDASTEDAESIAQQQRALSEQTQQALEELSEMTGASADLGDAAQEAQAARSAQGAAQQDLDEGLPFPAADAQDQASEALRRAAEAARQAGQQPGTPQPDQNQDPGGDPSGDPGQTTDDGQPSDADPSERTSESPDDAELAEIEEQERSNRTDREALRRAISVPGTRVERDW